tara:strand:+ start:2016 stop:2264 length:249 start_codon:yes stop_codon:yes gene_type:complete
MSKENIKDKLFNDALKQLAVMNMGKADYFSYLNKVIDQGIASELSKCKDDERLEVKINKIIVKDQPYLKIDFNRVKKDGKNA